ncbi:MAG: peptidylprolyl isomerase, partial [Chloroflexota bacterium]
PPTTQRQITFSHAPAMTINPQHQYSATMVTSDGTFTIGLDPKIAPITVNNFVFLARHKFYDGVVFHRILKNFMVQTGDPTGTGSGGPGYTFKDETVSQPYTRGTVAMANSGPNTNGSQFFVIVAPKRYPLPPRYTIFGGVTQGMSVVQKIADTPVAPNPGTGELSDPVNPVTLKKVTIHESA